MRIVADDLTGALDSAAPFAAAGGPLPVFWDRAMVAGPGASYALDTESREQGPTERPWLHHLEGAELAFKKIDSLLRGNTAAEIAACLAGGDFRSAIIAPAFPAQDRVTRQGRQYWRAAGELAWRPVDQDLLLALRRSLPVMHAKSARALAGDGFFLCDAETEEQLRAIVAAGRRMAGPRLWCGTAGLARALAGPATRCPDFAPAAPLLLLIGTDHPVSRAQVAALQAHRPDLVAPIGSGDDDAIQAAVSSSAEAIGRGSSSALALALPTTSTADARAVLARALELVAAQVPMPGTLFVTGGETLHGLLRALGATSLLATGELCPGVPCSRIASGRWHDLAAISKSGAFGEQGLLIRLAESVMP